MRNPVRLNGRDPVRTGLWIRRSRFPNHRVRYHDPMVESLAQRWMRELVTPGHSAPLRPEVSGLCLPLTVVAMRHRSRESGRRILTSRRGRAFCVSLGAPPFAFWRPLMERHGGVG